MLNQKFNFFICEGKAKVNNIPELHAIHFYNFISRNQLQLFRQTTGFHGQYFPVAHITSC